MPSKDEVEFAKAYKDLIEAENTAATLEAQLSSLEQKLDDFLTQHDKPEVEGGAGKGADALPDLSKRNKDGIEKPGST